MRWRVLKWKIKNSRLWRWLFPAIIAFLLIFSTPVHASEIALNANFITSTTNRTVDQWGSGCSDLVIGINSYVHNGSTSASCSISQFYHTTGFDSFGWVVNNNYYLKVTGVIYELRDREPLDAILMGAPSLIVYYVDAEQRYADLVFTSTESVSEGAVRFEWLFKLTNPQNLTIRGFAMTGMGVNLKPNEFFTLAGYYLYTINNLTVNVDTKSIVDAIKQTDNASGIAQQTEEIKKQTEEVSKTNDLLEEQQKQDQQDRSNLENQSSDADDAVSDASEVAENATASLLNAAATLVSIVRDTPASNCRINGDFGNINLGQMDFCSGKPSGINNLIAVAIALALTPIAWVWATSLVRQTVGLAESVTGGRAE